MSISPSSVNTENCCGGEELSSPNQRATDESWDITQERMLLYLKYLHVPPGKEQLSLALEAISRLGNEEDKQDITPASMRALRNLLSTSGLPVISIGSSKLYSMGHFTQALEGLQSTPLVNRGHMFPIKFEQLPEWLSTESFLTTVITQLRPLLIPLLILFNILLLVALFFWL